MNLLAGHRSPNLEGGHGQNFAVATKPEAESLGHISRHWSRPRPGGVCLHVHVHICVFITSLWQHSQASGTFPAPILQSFFRNVHTVPVLVSEEQCPLVEEHWP